MTYLIGLRGQNTSLKIRSMHLSKNADDLKNYIWRLWRIRSILIYPIDTERNRARNIARFTIYEFDENGDMKKRLNKSKVLEIMKIDDLEITVRMAEDNFKEYFIINSRVFRKDKIANDVDELRDIINKILKKKRPQTSDFNQAMMLSSTFVHRVWNWEGEKETKEFVERPTVMRMVKS